MVRRGEYLERAVVIPHETGQHLEGLYHRGRRSPGVVMAPPGPDEGAMESAVIAELAWAVTRAGLPTIRFNYRGVGASQGVFDGPATAYPDLQAAVHQLRVSVAGGDEANLPPIAALGVGLGATLVTRLALEGSIPVSPLILVSPQVEALPATLATFPGELVFVRAQLDETVDGQALATLAEKAPDGRLATVPLADRAFVRGLVELGKIVAETLAPPGLIDLGD